MALQPDEDRIRAVFSRCSLCSVAASFSKIYQAQVRLVLLLVSLIRILASWTELCRNLKAS